MPRIRLHTPCASGILCSIRHNEATCATCPSLLQSPMRTIGWSSTPDHTKPSHRPIPTAMRPASRRVFNGSLAAAAAPSQVGRWQRSQRFAEVRRVRRVRRGKSGCLFGLCCHRSCEQLTWGVATYAVKQGGNNRDTATRNHTFALRGVVRA